MKETIKQVDKSISKLIELNMEFIGEDGKYISFDEEIKFLMQYVSLLQENIILDQGDTLIDIKPLFNFNLTDKEKIDRIKNLIK